MHGSTLSLTVWFWAIYLMASHSNGISALQLQKKLGLRSYKSAWFLAAKLRLAMVAPGWSPLAGLVTHALCSFHVSAERVDADSDRQHDSFRKIVQLELTS